MPGERRMLLIVPAAFLNSLAIGVANLGMLFVVKFRYGAGAEAVGAFAALWSMAYFAGCVALRPLSRRLTARASMATMTFASAVLLGLHLVLPGLVSAFICYGLYGFATALFWPRIMGWLSAGLEGAALSRAAGSFNVSWSAGGVISPFLAGLIAERDPFLAVGVAAIVFAATGGLIMGSRRLVPSPPLATAAAAALGQDRSSALRYPAWIGVVLAYALIAVFFNIFPVYAADELGMSESGIGLVLLGRALATALGFWFFGRFEFWHGKPWYIPLAALLLLCIDILFAFLGSPLPIALAVIAAGFVLALSYNASIFYGASGAADRDRRMTIHESLLTAGQIVGSVAGGAIYQRFSWSLIFAALSLLFALGIGAQFLALRRRR